METEEYMDDKYYVEPLTECTLYFDEEQLGVFNKICSRVINGKVKGSVEDLIIGMCKQYLYDNPIEK